MRALTLGASVVSAFYEELNMEFLKWILYSILVLAGTAFVISAAHYQPGVVILFVVLLIFFFGYWFGKSSDF